MLINIVENFKFNTFMADLLWKVSNTIIELWNFCFLISNNEGN